MASARISTALQEELDISTKISSLESRASNLEAEFSKLLQTARQLVLATKRYVEKMEIENKSWDLLENILESENNSRQILDYLKIFFNFLLGRLQRHGANIVDIFMLWTLLDTEGVSGLFIDTIAGFGFKKKDVNNIRLLLAVVCKDHREMIEGDEETTTTKVVNTADNVVKKSKEAGGKATNADENDPNLMALAVGKTAENIESIVLQHDHSVEDLLKKWEANEGINIFGMDEELRNVLKRMIAVVIFTLNIGKKKASGLYDSEIKTDNQNNSAESVEYDEQANGANRNVYGRDHGVTEKNKTNNIKMENSQECSNIKRGHAIQTTLRNMNNNASTDGITKVATDRLKVPSLKNLVLYKIAKSSAVITAGNRKRSTSDLDNSGIKEEIKINDNEGEKEYKNCIYGTYMGNCSNQATFAESRFNDIVPEDEKIEHLEQNMFCEHTEGSPDFAKDDAIEQLEAFLLLN